MVTVVYIIISYFVFKFMFNYLYTQQKDIAIKSNYPITFAESVCVIAMSLLIAAVWPLTIPILIFSHFLTKWLESIHEKNKSVGMLILEKIDKTMNGRKE